MIRTACNYCSGEFEARIGDIRRGQALYCSMGCRNKNRWRAYHADPDRWFWPFVDRRAPNECWPWTGKQAASGYGRLKREGRSIPAHRTSLSLATGRWPDSETMALHSCDNRPCCNPAHLRWGTAADNMRDRSERGRAKGHPRKIDADRAALMRSAGKSYQQIAEVFSVNQANVGKALKRREALLTALANKEAPDE